MRVAVVGAVPLVRHGLVLQLVARGVSVHAEASKPGALPAGLAPQALVALVGARDDPATGRAGLAAVLDRGVAVLALTDGPGTWLGLRVPARTSSDGAPPAGPERLLRPPGNLHVAALDDVSADDVVAWLAAVPDAVPLTDAVASGGAHADAGPGTHGGPVLTRRLTGAERDVLELLSQGLSNAGIAERLSVSPKTIECHVSNLFEKLGLPQHDPALNRRVAATLHWLALVH
ncbi:helix-turn-helix transcriptional regulator [Actinotalea ferrariae]|uniref:helix-turn-helix transcriptional regulator n=1 Tax=Actinotalea ferrariae TaxID=1386098 RepID=UPI001ED62DB3|nr:LuxR C-terminal-related transcriptional regulator [Actinotalea ferrariae]MBX9244117.1 helix-turn-helix transcriptional regulator [Actinotalea ferrariae]